MVIAPLVSALNSLTTSIQTLINQGLQGLAGKASPPPEKKPQADKSIQELAKELIARQDKNAAIKAEVEKLRPSPPPGPGSSPSPAGKGGGIGVPNIGGLIAGNPAVAALTAIPAALGALTAAVTPFVRAFNPAVVELFNRALDNVQATIGAALSPVLEIFTDALRQVNDIIAPTFERLRPVVEAFANHLVGILLPALDLILQLGKAIMPLIGVVQQVQAVIDTVFKTALIGVSTVLSLLAPWFRLLAVGMQPFLAVLQFVAKAVEGVARVVQTVVKIVMAVVEGVLDLLSGLLAPILGKLPSLTDVLDGMAKVVGKVVENMVLFAANLLALIGFTSGLKALQKAFTPEKGQGKIAAPKDLGISTLEEQFKKLTLAAAGAIGGTQARTQEELLSDLGDKVQKIIDGGPEFGKQFKTMAEDIRTIAEVLGRFGKGGQDTARATLLGILGPLGLLGGR